MTLEAPLASGRGYLFAHLRNPSTITSRRGAFPAVRRASTSSPLNRAVRGCSVRMEDDYFDDIPDEKIPKDMLDLASHIVNTKAGRFDSDKFEDQYEDALKDGSSRDG